MFRTDSPVAQPGLYFDRVADLYDRVRAGYPSQLFDDILSFAGNPPVKRALEIGCATGQATLPFAQRGIRLVCLEPGNNLTEIARRNLASFNNVEIIGVRFEEWRPQAEPFDLVFSANAIHWVKRKFRARKPAQVLRPSGTLAIFRSIPIRSDTTLEKAIDSALEKVPSINEEPEDLPRENYFRESGYFERFEKLCYESSQEYDANAYIELLSTLNRYRDIPADERAKRFRKVYEIIMDSSEKIRIRYVTQLLLAHRKACGTWWKSLFGLPHNRS